MWKRKKGMMVVHAAEAIGVRAGWSKRRIHANRRRRRNEPKLVPFGRAP